MRLRFGSVFATAVLAGCKIVQTSTPGGSIASASGDHDCAEDSVCEIDIPNGEPFQESFTAVARYRYAFAGWRGTESYLCAGLGPTCTVDIPGSITRYDATGYMTAEFYHQPELLYPGSLGAIPGIFAIEVTDINVMFRYAGDLDGDGDDDVVIASGTNPDEEFTAARGGLILINEGDDTFDVAQGDRPQGVHPREVLTADFNGDGRTDVFIADHGYDVHPFPGWSNQLLLATETGYDDVSDRLPPDDTTGFTHNAAVGDVDCDGDVDILVANNGGEYLGGAPYLLLNDGEANFTVDQSMLPERVVEQTKYWPWATDMPDLDSDGHVDLLMGGKDDTGQSYIHWGPDFDELTVLPVSDYFVGFGDAVVISTAVHDIDGDGRTDILLGGYRGGGGTPHRGLQVLINAGNRTFEDQTRRRLGVSAWSPDELWHLEHRLLDFNGDGTVDIVPQMTSENPGNVLAWLNDGTGHYVALKTTMFPDSADAVGIFAAGLKLRNASVFRVMEFFGTGDELSGSAAFVETNATITLAE